MVSKSSYAHGEFSWVDLSSHGMAAMAEFYAGVFGWKVADQDTEGGPPYAQFELPDGAIAGLGELNDEMKAQGVPPTWNSYVNVDDVEAVTVRAAELGATVIVPAMKVLEAGWLAFILDPLGACIALWQKGDHAGAVRKDEPGTFCWNEMATRDVEASRDFYTELFGWETKEYPGLPTKYYVVQAGGEDVGGLMQMSEEWGDAPSHWAVYFSVDDIDETLRRVKDGGGAVHVEPFETPVGKIAVLADPQGAMFSVLQKTASC